jgi:uncharacterized protein (DUF1015 family)
LRPARNCLDYDLHEDTNVPAISPFRALRYNTRRLGHDLSKFIAPPYDVLDNDGKAALLRQSEYNIVAVDLPHVPPKSAGPDEVYARSAATLNAWAEAGVMGLETEPALYVYHQDYTHAGRTFTRRMFFARMRLEQFGAGTVFPHEQTFGGPKEDRLKLMQATNCQLSAVFGLYSDPSNAVSAVLDMGAAEPDATATLEGVINRMWVVREKSMADDVSHLLLDRPVYIADGHHRYGTALLYREWLSVNQGPLEFDHPANFVLVGFCAMEDPGCVILPTHRVLSGFGRASSQQVMAALGKGLRLHPAQATPNAAAAALTLESPDDVVVYDAAEDRAFVGRFTNREILNRMAPERTEPWRQLDLAYLHRYLIDELVTKETLGGTPPTIHYLKAADDALSDARATRGIAILTKPCTMAQLRAVSEAGDLMPQKSTYFYPKLATGLVVHPLTADQPNSAS